MSHSPNCIGPCCVWERAPDDPPLDKPVPEEELKFRNMTDEEWKAYRELKARLFTKVSDP